MPPPILPLEISSLILSHTITQILRSIHHPTFCFCAYHSAAPCSANIAATELHTLLIALPDYLKDELRRLCRLELVKRKGVERLWEQFYWWTWGDSAKAEKVEGEGSEGSIESVGSVEGESESESERAKMTTKMRRMRPCCREGVTEEMVRMFAEVMVLRQFALAEVGFVHGEI